MVLHMLSKANPAEILSRIKWAIAPCSFTAIKEWADDIQCLDLVESARIRVPFFLLFLRFVSTCSGVLLLVRHGRDATMTTLFFYFVYHHLHCQFFEKTTSDPVSCPLHVQSLPSVHLHNQHQESTLTPIRSWQWLFTSSTHCFPFLCWLKGSM